jgi:hypothetical protein
LERVPIAYQERNACEAKQQRYKGARADARHELHRGNEQRHAQSHVRSPMPGCGLQARNVLENTTNAVCKEGERRRRKFVNSSPVAFNDR